MADGSSNTDIDRGNNGPIKVAQILEHGVSLVGDEERMARGELAHGLRMRSGAVLHNVVPPFPFDSATDDLTFAQSATLSAARFEDELHKIETNPRLSVHGKDLESVPVYQQAIRGAAVAIRKVDDATKKAHDALSAFYDPPTLSPGDQVSAIHDAEARTYLRGLGPREMAKLIDRFRETNDPRIVRLLIGIVRSPLPIASNVEQSALAMWRNLREESDPDELGKRKARVQLADWASMVMKASTGLIAGRTQNAARAIAGRNAELGRGFRMGIFGVLDDDDYFRPTLQHFGFNPSEAEILRRFRKAAA